MKQNLRFLLLTLLCAMVGTAWGGTETIDFSTLGFTNEEVIETVSGTNFSVSFNKGTNSNTPKYYSTGTAIRVYGGGYFTVSSSNTINKIEITFGSGDGSNEITTDGGTYASGTWEGSSKSVKFSVGGTTGNRRIKAIKVTFEDQQQLTGEKYEIILGTLTSFAEGDYIITGNYGDSKYAMSNNVSNNAFQGKTDFAMDGDANIVTDDKTIVWHIAPQGDFWTIQSLDGNQYAAYAGSSNGVTMTSTLDDNALWSYNGNNGFANKANNANLYFSNGKFSFSQAGSTNTAVFTLYKMPDKYYVAGSWTEWADGKIEMTKNADGIYTLANQNLEEGAEFKIIKVVSAAEGAATIWCGGTADGDYYGVTPDTHKDISLNVGDGKNFKITIAGTWTFTVDPTGDTPTLTVDGDWPEWEYYLLGDFNEWGVGETSIDSYKFSQVSGTSTFTLNKPIKFGEKFKIYGKRGSEEKWFGAVSDGDFYVEENLVGVELSLTTENGGEHFYMDLSNKKDYWTLDFDPDNKKLILSNYLSDIAELPFKFDGGRNDIQNTAGLTTSGLGSDYGNGAPKLKFEASSQWLILHFDERPGTLSFDIKGNGFSGGTFQVLTSVDGEDYTILEEYTSISGANSGQPETFDNLGENVRYIKWLYKEKDNGNVGLGNIKLEKYVAPEYHTLTFNSVDHSEITVSYNDPNNSTTIESGDEVLSGSEVLISIDLDEYYYIGSLTVTDEDEAEVTLTKDGDTWTFTMPKSDVTISYTVEELDYDVEEWVLTPLADLTADDIFLIVGFVNNDPYAMINHNGDRGPETMGGFYMTGNRSIIRGIYEPISDEIKWNISGNATDGYTFYPNGDAEKWLYATNTNNGLRVGTGTANQFKLAENGYLTITLNTDQGDVQRYVGIYGTQDWRCYENIDGNIANQTFGFYKLVQPKKFEFSISESASDGTDCYATISALGDGLWIVKGDVEVSTVVVENNVLTYPFIAKEGDKIPGNGAYLVKGASGDYAFEKSKSPRTIDIGTNMLLSTGEGNIQTNAPTGEDDNNNYYFYKLTLKNSTPGSVGFYWGAAKGAPFTYGKAKQAYLAVPKTDVQNVQGFSFDGTTGIAEVESAATGNDGVYTISGVRVDGSNLSKGVYIVNGKKVIIK